MSAELLYPPMMLTDLPVSDAYPTIGRKAHQYAALSMCRIPAGFQNPEYAGGLAMAYIASSSGGGFLNGGPSLHVGLHAPAMRPGEYQRDWYPYVASIGLAPGTGNFGEGEVDCVLAAQRYGDKIYAFAGASTEPTNNARVWWFNYKEFSALTYSRGLYLADQIPYVPSSFSSRAAAHVSDEAEAKLWFVDGQHCLYFPDNGQDLGTYQFLSDYFSNFDQVWLGINPASGMYYSGRGHDGYDKVDYETTNGYGPALVFPWSSGDYGAPELWYFMYERDQNSGRLTQRLNVYRSTWTPGLHSNGNVGRTDFTFGQSDAIYIVGPSNETPTSAAGYGTNPGNYAFERNHTWFNTAHYVGTVGPFPGLYFPDPLNQTPLASGLYPSAIERIDVHRDPRRQDRLKLVLSTRFNTAPYRDAFRGFNQRLEGVWNSIFTAVSGNDGASWDRVQQISPPVHQVPMESGDSLDFYPESAANLSFRYPSVILDTGDVAVAHQAQHTIPGDSTPDGYLALSLPDYHGFGEADPTRISQVYKRGDLMRLSWV